MTQKDAEKRHGTKTKAKKPKLSIPGASKCNCQFAEVWKGSKWERFNGRQAQAT